MVTFITISKVFHLEEDLLQTTTLINAIKLDAH